MGNGNFKVGDKVKRITHPYDGCKIGTTGIVTKVNERYDTVRVKMDCDGREGTWAYSYIEIVENHPVAIIQHKGRETIATLKDGKTVLKTEKATCNPSDTFNAEFGRALALARLNDNQKMIDWLLRGEEKSLVAGLVVSGKPISGHSAFYPTQSRIVKQDKYEVGDKVKIVDNWVTGCYPNPEGEMDKWLGKIVTISKGIDRIYRILEDSGSWNWYELSIQGKVIEEPVTSGQSVTAPIATPFDWEGFKAGKIAVHCDTEEKAKQFFDELKMQGIKWSSGDEPSKDDTRWDSHESKMAYRCREGRGLVTGDTQYYQENGTSLIPYTPNYREVKRPAKVGEWIKVVSPDSTIHEGYSMGDLIHVGKLNGDSENGIVIEPFHIVQREYIVLEPITHSTETIAQPEPQYKEVKRLAEVGDLIKIVKEGVHGPDLIIGDIHKVERKDDFGGLHTDKYNVFNDYNQDEYVVLEPVNPTVQPKAPLDLSAISTDTLFEELRNRVN